jgi:predicted ATPase
MKAARVHDLQRRLVSKANRWKYSLSTFSVKEIPSLGSIDIPFTSPLTIICGPNGVGKSTLLTALRATLDGSAGAPGSNQSRKLASGGSYLSLEADGIVCETEVSFNNGVPTRQSGTPQDVVFISTGETIFSLQDELCEFDSREDLINGSGTKNLNEQELEEVNYILKRDYRRIAVSEVELEQEKIVPFFEASYGDDDYDSRTMGTGELAALYIWWKLKSAGENSFILLEEPETFLSPATQVALGDFLLSEAFSRGHCITMTSHSAALISPLPASSLKFIFRAGGTLRLSDPPTPSMLEKLGIRSSVNMLLLVEDAAARNFLKLLLEQVDPILSANVAIEIMQGHGGITRALDGLKDLKGPIRFLGVYDGDMRGNGDIQKLQNALFLPGDDAIESAFKKFVIANPEQLAANRGIPQEKVLEILYGAEGADVHDWYEALCVGLGLSREQLLSALFVLWKREPANAKAIDEWHTHLRDALKAAR